MRSEKPKKKTTAIAKREAGRPPAKHSSPDYTQTSIYISNDVRSLTKIELFKENGEFSGLVESLLRTWLKARGVEVPALKPVKRPN